MQSFKKPALMETWFYGGRLFSPLLSVATLCDKYETFCLQMCLDDTLYKLVSFKHSTALKGNQSFLN